MHFGNGLVIAISDLGSLVTAYDLEMCPYTSVEGEYGRCFNEQVRQIKFRPAA